MTKFLDKLEDKVRYSLSRHPRLYAFISGVAIVLFWHGVEGVADILGMGPLLLVVISVVVMLLTGTFVSFFVGARLLISGLKEEKRIDEKTIDEIRDEEAEIVSMKKAISEIHRDLSKIRESIESVGRQ